MTFRLQCSDLLYLQWRSKLLQNTLKSLPVNVRLHRRRLLESKKKKKLASYLISPPCSCKIFRHSYRALICAKHNTRDQQFTVFRHTTGKAFGGVSKRNATNPVSITTPYVRWQQPMLQADARLYQPVLPHRDLFEEPLFEVFRCIGANTR